MVGLCDPGRCFPPGHLTVCGDFFSKLPCPAVLVNYDELFLL
jgi:hypothetical protein